MTFHLPWDITIEILSRLPVKSLLRFKSVCKDWYALIKTPSFIAKHLLTLSTLNPTSLIVTSSRWYTVNKSKTCAMPLLFDDGFSGPIDFPFLPDKKYHSIWGPTRENYFRVVGICNGLVCISLSLDGYPLFLCNPSTRQFQEILGAERTLVYEKIFINRISYGFGFHPSANDYKLIRIVNFSYTHHIGEDYFLADLYVMSTGTWTRIDVDKLSLFNGEWNELEECEDTVEIDGSAAAAVLNGVFYWSARFYQSDEAVVVSFDMDKEVFRKMTTPELLNWTCYWQFMEVDDKFGLIVFRDERVFDVWLWNENESSWTKQIQVGYFPRNACYGRYGKRGERTMVGGGKNGELLVVEHKVSGDLKLFSYDTKTRQTMDLCFSHVQYDSYVLFYAGTLLPVMQANELVLN